MFYLIQHNIFFFYTSMFRLQWDNNLWSIKEDYLRNISVFLFIQWKSLVSKLVLVTNILFLLLTNILHYFLLCSIKESKWYRFETTWGWVDDDRFQSLKHSFIRFVQTADLFQNQVNGSLYEWALNHWFSQFVQHVHSFRNETLLARRCTTVQGGIPESRLCDIPGVFLRISV